MEELSWWVFFISNRLPWRGVRGDDPKGAGLGVSVRLVGCLQRAMPAFVPGLLPPPSSRGGKSGKFIRKLTRLGHEGPMSDVICFGGVSFGIIVCLYGCIYV